MLAILKVFIDFVTGLRLFYVLLFFGPKAYGILAPSLGIEPAPLALEGEVLTTGQPGKSLVGSYQQVAFISGVRYEGNRRQVNVF